jgi:AcrR family transcriptional regulator
LFYSGSVSDVKRRSYHSPVREQQAAATRVRISEAAAEEFVAHGWAGTTVGAIALRAGVTPQAVHLSVGAKPALLLRAVETAVAGAGDDIPLADRVSFVDVYRPAISVRRRLIAFARATADVYSRAARLFLVLQDAARIDPTVAELAHDGGRRRLENNRRLVDLLLPNASEAARAKATDQIWILAGPGVYVDAVHQRGWTSDQYIDFLTNALLDATARARRPTPRKNAPTN